MWILENNKPAFINCRSVYGLACFFNVITSIMLRSAVIKIQYPNQKCKALKCIITLVCQITLMMANYLLTLVISRKIVDYLYISCFLYVFPQVINNNRMGVTMNSRSGYLMLALWTMPVILVAYRKYCFGDVWYIRILLLSYIIGVILNFKNIFPCLLNDKFKHVVDIGGKDGENTDAFIPSKDNDSNIIKIDYDSQETKQEK